jgi:hypothetical protein
MHDCYLRLSSKIRRALHTHTALRRSDFLGVLQFCSERGALHNSVSLYAWYRLGCYETVLNIAKEYQPKSARDITAISVSLAATGRFQDCESFIVENLRKLRRNKRFAIETAQGIVKFNPYLARKLVKHLRSTADFRAACHLALGHRNDALKTFLLNKRPTRKDIVAGHYLIEANLTNDISRKIEALNRHLSDLNLSGVQVADNASVFCLDMLRNVKKSSLNNSQHIDFVL